MDNGEGVSYSMAAALAAVITLSLSFLAYSLSQPHIQASQQQLKPEAERHETLLREKVSLIYWSDGGRAWISNHGDVDVVIIRIYVDDREVWQSRGGGLLRILPGETRALDLGVRGAVLVIETAPGGVHVLRR